MNITPNEITINNCELCPNRCNVDRTNALGKCLCDDKIHIAYSGLHMWEEPVISGKKGSGAIFFSGCTMRCIFCQNKKISRQIVGDEYSVDDLSSLISELSKKADNINLVSPTPYVLDIIKAVKKAQPKVPIIYNTSGYENVDTIKLLDGIVDVWLPDLKYVDSDISRTLSGKNDYFKYAFRAISQMIKQTGKPLISKDNLIQKGVIVRHLIIPSYIQNTLDVIKVFGENFKDDALFSLMAQYTPVGVEDFEKINRRITPLEYKRALKALDDNRIANGFVQELSSASCEYIPNF